VNWQSRFAEGFAVIADEESHALKLLVDRCGVEATADEIKIFFQHRLFYQLMKRMAELAAICPVST
jgi:hypothetical protein